MIRYRVESSITDNDYRVIGVTTVAGERLDAYSSEPSKTYEDQIFKGNLSDCYAYIKLQEEGYFKY